MKRSSRKNSSAARQRQRSQRVASKGSGPGPAPLAQLRQGRDQGESILYDPGQNYNYKTEEIRYGKGTELAPQVMRPDGGGFRVPSSGRSTAGYWQPGAVRLFCSCGETPQPHGRIIQFEVAPQPHEILVQTASAVTLLRWVSEPNCEFQSPDFEPVASAEPNDGVVTLPFTPVGNPFFSLEVGSGYSAAFLCFRILDLSPNSTVLQPHSS